MWFKQVQLFQLDDSINYVFLEGLEENLQALAFRACMPSMPHSMGWVAPVESDEAEGEEECADPLVRTINGYSMLCLQIEEKILPAAVIRQELDDTIKQIEAAEGRKLGAKHKFSLKEEVTMTLLPRAFSKLNRLYAYIDIKNHWLVLGTANAKKAEQFLSIFKKSVTESIYPIKVKNLSATMTNWLKHQDYPSHFAVEKACVLQDPKQENRVIRCKQQDLFVTGIQSLIKDGCEAMQLAMSWQDRVNFVLSHDFSLNGIQFQDELLAEAKDRESESRRQQFDVDFLIMTETFTALLKDLTSLLVKSADTKLVQREESIPVELDI